MISLCLVLSTLLPLQSQAYEYYINVGGSTYSTATTLTVTPTNATSQSTLLLTATTTGVNWSGVTVSFYLDDVLVGTNKTVATGTACQAQLYLTTAGLTSGAHTLRAEFPATQRTFTELFATEVIYNHNGSIKRVDHYYYRWTDTARASSGTASVATDPSPPLFAPLTNQFAFTDADVTFAVTNTIRPLSFQWHFQGANLAGATNSTLLLADVQTNQAGTYLVVGTDADGLATASEASLVVGAPPRITTQPTSQTVDTGNSATFTVAASGSTPLSYQWWFNGNPLARATNTTLNLNNVTTNQAGSYSVVVTNAYGTATSQVAQLQVLANPPEITAQPQSQRVAIGISASFAVTAAGSPTLRYQWRFNGNPLPGATTATLTLYNITATQAGTYSVVVTNAYGTATSDTALLTVDPSRLDATFNPGADGWVTCLALQADERILVAGSFTTLGGQSRGRMGRLHPDGALDPQFNPAVNDTVGSLALQTDGKILTSGYFTTLAGQPRSYLGRLNPDGTIDPAFLQGADWYVYTLALQREGSIIAGGAFQSLGGQTRSRIGRCNPDGTLDEAFNPGAGPDYTYILALAFQADGSILVGGKFTTLAGQTRKYLGRLNEAGALDAGFNPTPEGSAVHALAVQADGKILVGGNFTALGGQPRTNIARLNADGTLDADFNPGASGGWVSSLALQADGRILVGGHFTTLAGQPRSGLGRLNADGTIDPDFNEGASGGVESLALQADGRILVGGSFTRLGGQSRMGIARLNSTEPATQNISYDGSTATWLRGGTSPEVWRTTFEYAPDGATWSLRGEGVRTPGGWELAGVTLPTNGTIRARGFVTGGQYNASSWFVETTLSLGEPVGVKPSITRHPESRTVIVGEEAKNLSVIATGTPPLTYQWRKDQVDIAGATNANYIIASAQPTHAGVYSVLVSNAYGSATSSNAVLTVEALVAPSITSHPQSQTVAAGAGVTFSVVATGTPPLTYQWRKDQVNIAGATNASYSIASAQSTHAGVYSVVVSNPAGPVTSTAATLTVQVPDTIITSVVETGGDDEPGHTVTAKWTGISWSDHPDGVPVLGIAAGQPYTVGRFEHNAPAMVDRNHRYADPASSELPIPAYLVGSEYIMCGNDNRDNLDYRLDVTVSVTAQVYLLVDNRLGDDNSADPPLLSPTMQWVLDDGWEPVTTGANRASDPARPDEVGLDEGADGSLNNWFSVYGKSFLPGTFSLLQQADGVMRIIYGVVVRSAQLQAGITRSDVNLVLSWPSPSPGYELQETSALNGPATQWQAVTQVPAIVGDAIQVIVPMTSANRFYRLAVKP